MRQRDIEAGVLDGSRSDGENADGDDVGYFLLTAHRVCLLLLEAGDRYSLTIVLGTEF